MSRVFIPEPASATLSNVIPEIPRRFVPGDYPESHLSIKVSSDRGSGIRMPLMPAPAGWKPGASEGHRKNPPHASLFTPIFFNSSPVSFNGRPITEEKLPSRRSMKPAPLSWMP